MARPHPALIHLAAGRPMPPIDDIDAVVRSAEDHRMSGLLLRNADVSLLSHPAAHHLPHKVGESRERHQRFWQVLDSVTARLEGIGIEVATFKGVTAEARWYDGLGDRPCRDIDLLLPFKDFDRAGDVVDALQKDAALSRAVQVFVDRRAIQAVTVTVEDVAIDLHFNPLKIGIWTRQHELIWDRSRLLALGGGGTIRVLDPETTLIQLLMHLNKDRFRYLLGFVDVVRLLEREAIDLAFVSRFLTNEGLLDPVSLSLSAVGKELMVQVPSLSRPRGLRARFWLVAWGPKTRLPGRAGRTRHRLRGELLGLLARGRSREGWASLWHFFFPPRGVYELHNPGARGPYLWRLFLDRPLKFVRRYVHRPREGRTGPQG